MDCYAHRKGTRRVIVKKNGELLKNTAVSGTLMNHEFLFGAGAFDFTSMVSGGTKAPFTRDLGDGLPFLDKEHPAIYKERCEKWLKLLNYGTVPFYLDGYEPEEGVTEYESRKAACDILTANGKTIKGHNLVWHTCCARWLMEYDNKTIMNKILGRIEREVSEFKGQIDIWDVINEPVIMPVYDKYDNAVSRICKEYGQVELIRRVFSEAHRANPEAELLINDFNLSDDYADLIERALDAGAPISTIGIQTHQHKGYMGLPKLQEILHRFEKFGLPMHFTEISILSGKPVPADNKDLNDVNFPDWPSTEEGEARQAAELSEMYHELFAHPLIKAATNWDFVDGSWINAPSGYLRKDNTEKPSYQLIYDLMHKEWCTDIKTVTDEYGGFLLEGYKGEYELLIDGKKVRVKLSDDTNEIIVNI